MDTVRDKSHLEAVDQGKVPTPGGEVAIQIRLMAIAAAARFHGAELHRSDLRVVANDIPSPAALTDWLRGGGLVGESGSVVLETTDRPQPCLARCLASKRRQCGVADRQRQEARSGLDQALPTSPDRSPRRAQPVRPCKRLDRRGRPDARQAHHRHRRVAVQPGMGCATGLDGTACHARRRAGIAGVEHPDRAARADGHDGDRPGRDPSKPVHSGHDVAADRRRHAVRDPARLRPPPTDPDRRRPRRCQAQPARLPAAAPPAAGLFRAQSGRLRLVDDRAADQQDPRIPHRQTAHYHAGPGHLGRAAADPFLSCSRFCPGWCCSPPA